MAHKKPERKFTLCLDIDGTLARYDGKYDPDNIGEPLPYAARAVRGLAKKFLICLFTTRPRKLAVAWAKKHNIPFDSHIQKPLNWLIVDDRCLQFRGNWPRTLGEINLFQPWYRKRRR